jgi:hypothetical protein
MEKLKPEFRRILIIVIVFMGGLGGVLGFSRGFSETSNIGISMLFAIVGGIIGIIPFLVVYFGIKINLWKISGFTINGDS